MFAAGHRAAASWSLGSASSASLPFPAPAAICSTRLLRRTSLNASAATPLEPAVVPALTYSSTPQTDLVYESKNGLKRLKYTAQGWNYYDWEGKKMHYISAGEPDRPVVILVHGYGASSYHWRYNIPALADAGYRVYAVDLLGFGYAEKSTTTDYSNGAVWVRQLSSFVKDVVRPQAQGRDPTSVVLVGNSLGGYASLATASAHPELVRAVALLNGAGPFAEPGTAVAVQEDNWMQSMQKQVYTMGKRVVLRVAFERAKQPSQIKDVLGFVYANKDQIDDDLVTSIVNPALDPNAADVFFLVNNSTAPPVTVNSLLKDMRMPLLLLWGDLDPWIVPARAQRIMSIYPTAEKVGLQSGHCPHDDSPADTNVALIKWLSQLPAEPAASTTTNLGSLPVAANQL